MPEFTFDSAAVIEPAARTSAREDLGLVGVWVIGWLGVSLGVLLGCFVGFFF